MDSNKLTLALAVIVVLSANASNAAIVDTFGSGSDTFNIEFVTIGNPGNAADTTGNPNPAGSVSYTYRIGKFEISEDMIDKANTLGSLGLTHNGLGANKPAAGLSWFEAARFVNWLNTSTNNTRAYKFDSSGNFQLWQSGDVGYDPNNLFRNSQAHYFLPSADEWYKAAYYDPIADIYYDYPTGSDSEPDGSDFAGDPVFDAVFFDDESNGGPNDVDNVGLLSPYGTAGQGGNAWDMLETAADLVNESTLSARIIRGSVWGDGSDSLLSSNRFSVPPGAELDNVGFRVASVATIISGGDTTGIAVEDFENFDFDSYVTLNSPALGISFGEKFVGQTNTPDGDFDEIGGLPDSPLALDTTVAQDVGVTVFPRATKTIAGLGPTGYPNADAIGEGSLAVLYAVDQEVIAFEIGNIDLDINNLDIQFYSRSGVLLDDLNVDLVTPNVTPVVFSSTGAGIAGIVIDQSGIGTGGVLFDNFRVQMVPEPTVLSELLIDSQPETLVIDGNVAIDAGAEVDVTPGYSQTSATLETILAVTHTGTLTGQFANEGEHLRDGIFVDTIHYNANDITVDLLQAAPGDVNGDRRVDSTDIQLILASLSFNNLTDGPYTWLQGDVTGDGFVGSIDIQTIVAANLFGKPAYAALPANVAVPEPSSLALAVVAMLGLMGCGRRRRRV